MKKKLFSIFAIAILLVSLALPAMAEETEYFVYLIDSDYGVSDEEVDRMDAAAKEISDRYNCGVYIAVFDDMADYDCYDIEEFSEMVYTNWELGYGSESTGVALVMSMSERDYDIVAYGNGAHYAFTDYGKEVVADRFLDNFRNDDWAGGFADYITACGELLEAAENGMPVDVSVVEAEPLMLADKLLTGLGVGIVLGVIVALIYCSILKAQMKTAVAATQAHAYIPRGGIVMTRETDHYTYSTESRVAINRDDDNDHGGGTTVNSDGFSHSSGKF